MRIILQRVSEASVTVGGSVISSIGPGVMCLVGLHETDTEADVDYIVKTVLSAKVFADAEGRPWRQSVVAKGFDVLLVSPEVTAAEAQEAPRPAVSQVQDQRRLVSAPAMQRILANWIPELRVARGHQPA